MSVFFIFFFLKDFYYRYFFISLLVQKGWEKERDFLWPLSIVNFLMGGEPGCIRMPGTLTIRSGVLWLGLILFFFSVECPIS